MTDDSEVELRKQNVSIILSNNQPEPFTRHIICNSTHREEGMVADDNAENGK